jgi:YidC/Oxa1 family membrane protein insertase
MNFYAFPPVAAVLDGAYHLLSFLSTLLTPLFPVASSAAAIVLITLLVRAALIPVGVSQARAQENRRRIAPKLAALRKRWAKNPERLQKEMMALYREEKTSPFAGILPTLIQIPVISTVYGLFIHPDINGHANDLLQHTVFGVPLGSSLASMLGGPAADPSHAIVFVVLLALIAAGATLTRRLLAPVPADLPADPSAAVVPGSAAIAKVLSYTPYVTVVIGAFVPLAATLYLTVTTTWTLVERTVLRRRMTSSMP